MRKALRREVSKQEMLHMREIGMTNKQIAESLDCSISTVYSYIGKMSFAVANAIAQNKPLPVPTPVEPAPDLLAIDRPVMEAAPVLTGAVIPAVAMPVTMPVLKERRIVELKGECCVFEVDTGDKVIILKSGGESALITGMLDAESLDRFIWELTQIREMLAE